MKKFIISFIISILSLFATAQMDIPPASYNPSLKAGVNKIFEKSNTGFSPVS